MSKTDHSCDHGPRPLEPAEIAKLQAETQKVSAEAREAAAKADIAEMSRAKATIDLEREQEKREREKTDNKYHRVYVFDDQVTEASVKKCVQEFMTWSRQYPECSIELQLNSGGGSIFDGFALIDCMRELSSKGHEITTVGLGCVASMAGVILQAGDVRVMGAHALLLIHEGSLGAMGDFGKVEDRLKLMSLMHDRILTLFEARAKPINPKTTKAFIKNHWQRKDWWLDAHAAANLGLIDSVR